MGQHYNLHICRSIETNVIIILLLYMFLLQDNDTDLTKNELSGDALDITAAILSGKMSHDVSEAIAESPALHSSFTSTLFETIVHLFDWFSSHPSLSKEAFSKNLRLWHSLLPEGNLLPTSYQEAYKTIRPYFLPEIVFHVCINDCILYREVYKDSVVCPYCSEPRFGTKKCFQKNILLPAYQPKAN